MDPEAGFLLRDSVVLAVEVLECCPWCACLPLQHQMLPRVLDFSHRRSDSQVCKAAPQHCLLPLGESGVAARLVLLQQATTRCSCIAYDTKVFP